MATYTIPASLVANTVLTANYVNIINDDLRVISQHGHSGSLGDGAVQVSSASAACPWFYRYEIQTMINASQSNWGTSSFSNSFILTSQMSKTVTANAASLSFPVGLFAGTYKVWVLFNDQQSGSAAIFIAGASVGSLKATGTANLNTVCALSGITVVATGSTVFQFVSGVAQDFRVAAFKIKKTG